FGDIDISQIKGSVSISSDMWGNYQMSLTENHYFIHNNRAFVKYAVTLTSGTDGLINTGTSRSISAMRYEYGEDANGYFVLLRAFSDVEIKREELSEQMSRAINSILAQAETFGSIIGDNILSNGNGGFIIRAAISISDDSLSGLLGISGLKTVSASVSTYIIKNGRALIDTTITIANLYVDGSPTPETSGSRTVYHRDEKYRLSWTETVNFKLLNTDSATIIADPTHGTFNINGSPITIDPANGTVELSGNAGITVVIDGKEITFYSRYSAADEQADPAHKAGHMTGNKETLSFDWIPGQNGAPGRFQESAASVIAEVEEEESYLSGVTSEIEDAIAPLNEIIGAETQPVSAHRPPAAISPVENININEMLNGIQDALNILADSTLTDADKQQRLRAIGKEWVWNLYTILRNAGRAITVTTSVISNIITKLRGLAVSTATCAIQSLFSLLKGFNINITGKNLLEQAIIIDILTGVLNEATASSSKLELSMYAIQLTAASHGVTLHGVNATLDQMALTGEAFIAHVNGNHFIVVTKIEGNNVTVIDGGNPVTMTRQEFMAKYQWGGNALTRVNRIGDITLNSIPENMLMQLRGAGTFIPEDWQFMRDNASQIASAFNPTVPPDNPDASWTTVYTSEDGRIKIFKDAAGNYYVYKYTGERITARYLYRFNANTGAFEGAYKFDE
ncbi:MAG: cysteine peptidase family C39 domain-containing protein, partial [Candidatus Desantisbacteria bacterium]